jgi:hypothetical protein
MNNLIALVATEAAEAAKRTEGTLEDKLRAAMRKGYRHWMVTDENDQLMGSLEGAARVLPDEDVARIEAELRLFQALSAASSGVPVDFERLLPDDEDEERPKPIGIRKLWDEVKAERESRTSQ